MIRSTQSIAGLAAIVFAVAILGANLIAVPAGLPRTGAEIGSVASFFASEGSSIGLSVALGPTAWVAAVLFGAGVVSAARRSAQDDAFVWALAGFAGILLQNATFTVVTSLRLALASTAGAGAESLWPLHDALFTLNGAFLALALLGLTVAGRRIGLTPRWHGALGLLAAALLFASATLAPLVVAHEGPLGLLGLVGWLLWVVWLVGFGLALLRADVAPVRA